MVIRPARASERFVLQELQRRSSLVHTDTRAALLADPGLIDLPAWHIAHTLVAERAGVPLGFAVVLPRTDGAAELDGLFVDAGRWREGVGAALIAAAVEAAQDMGAATLHVIANLNALAFYRASGFIDGATIDMRLSEALEMHRPLVRRAA